MRQHPHHHRSAICDHPSAAREHQHSVRASRVAARTASHAVPALALWWSALAVALTLVLAAPFASANEAENEATNEGFGGAITLLAGEDEGATRVAGLLLALDRGWKTYWREPGLSGLPPELSLEGSTNLAAAEWLWPTPHRLADPFGDAIGYEGRTLLPLRVTPQDPDAPITLRVSGLVGVCEKVCVPREIDLTLDVDGTESDRRIARALTRVPAEATATTATTLEDGRLIVTLNEPADDAFLHGPRAETGLGIRLDDMRFAFDLTEAVDDGPHGLVLLSPGRAQSVDLGALAD